MSEKLLTNNSSTRHCNVSDSNNIVCKSVGFDTLKTIWNTLSQREFDSIYGPGVCSSWEWHDCLRGYLLRDRDVKITAAYSNSLCVGILPLVETHQKHMGLKWKALEHWQEYAHTRPGLIIKGFDHKIMAEILSDIFNHDEYGSIKITVISGSNDERLLSDAICSCNLRSIKTPHAESGYIEHSDVCSEDGELYGLGKKFLHQIRRNRRLLHERYNMRVVFYDRSNQSNEFLGYMWDVENNTWKDDAGTSIPKSAAQSYLYTELFNKTIKRGWFLGTVLFCDDKPISYHYGEVYNNVYESLKTSYNKEYRKYSPAHVMRSVLIPKLLRDGIKVHDFIGVMDSGKKQWNAKSYKCTTYMLFANNLSGSLAYSKELLTSYKSRIISDAMKIITKLRNN